MLAKTKLRKIFFIKKEGMCDVANGKVYTIFTSVGGATALGVITALLGVSLVGVVQHWY